jgi:meso-butanediol dehydrogenase/(S,S)-butanediol dehydrogenase/diacetyl reductase
MSGRLAGKVAVITGTASGQGRAAALLFAREGARVVGCDLKATENEETTRLVKEAGGEMVAVHPIDLGDEGQARALVDFAVASYGQINILYNNAAALRSGRVTEMTAEDWHPGIRNGLDLVFYVIKHAAPVMARSGGGSIINTASAVGNVGIYIDGVYHSFAHAAVKGAVIAMTRVLAVELAPFEIRVNSISPSGVETPAWRELGERVIEQLKDELLKRQIIKRIGQPIDVAYLALYLASDESSFVTGQNFVVDGGLTAW